MSESFANNLSLFSLLYLALGFEVLVTATVQIYCWELACEQQVYRLRRMFFAQILRQDVIWYSKKEGGDLATKLSDDLERIREGIGHKLSMVIQYAATLVSGLVIGFLASWRLTLVLLGVGPLVIWASGHLANVVAVVSKMEHTRYSDAGGIVTQALTSVKTVAAFGGQEFEVERYKEALKRSQGVALKKYYHLSFCLAVVYFLTYAAYSLAFWYGSSLVAEGLATPGSIFTVFFSVLAGAFSVGSSLPFIHAVSTAVGAAVSVFAVLRRVPRVDPYDASGLRPARAVGLLRFEHVTFEYPSRPGVKVLRDFHLSMEPGRTVALVGPSGAGKSTVIGLLLRFYDVDQGQILLDGVNLKRLNLSWLRSQIGLVSQEPELFSATIFENICHGHENVSFTEVVHAAQTANAHDFIVALPEGYDTRVGEGGTRLSGGQKQRVAIARALVRNPKLLLLDEATSALDAESEGVVQDALERAIRGRTTVIVAHRLSTIRNAHVIHAMKDGQLMESGVHEELMARRGLYYHLVTAQTVDGGDEELTLSGTEDHWPPQDTDPAAAGPSGHTLVSRRMVAEKRSEEQAAADSNLVRLLQMHGPEWYWLVLGLLGCALTGSVVPIFAFFYGEVFNTFTLRGDELHAATMFWTYMFIGLACMSAISWFMQVISLTLASEHLVVRLRLLAFRNILYQAVGWYDLEESSARKMAHRLARDAPTVKAAAGWRVGQVVSASVTLLESLLTAFLSGWKLSLLAAVPVPLVIASHYKQAMTVRRHQRRDTELMSHAVRVASECVSNIKTVQALGKELHFLNLYTDFLRKPFQEAKKHAVVFSIVFATTQALIYTMYAAAFRFGAYLVVNNEMALSDVYRVFFALAFCAPAVGTTTSYLQDYAKAKMSAKLMLELVDLQPELERDLARGLKPVIRGKVSLVDVHFRYPARPDVEVLRGMTLTVEPGQTLALVGASGCGKSTVVSLIERFYDPSSGCVMFDDIDVRSINLLHLRSHVGIVTQEPLLFDSSIRDNIAYGQRSADMADIIRAAKVANIHDFVMSMPQRYDTVVGDRGAAVSGGQKQRIAIARAIVRDPKVLLLDEATSALDTENERVVQEALDRARRGRTCVVVAHRLSSVQGADCIALIQHGRVVEAGTHAQLQALRGRYYQLTKRQRL